MNFSNYYILQELSIKKNENVRFLALSDDKDDWVSKIDDIIETVDTSGINTDVTFLITDPTGNFVLNLVYNSNLRSFSYSVREESVDWMEYNNITSENDKAGFYYDIEAREFVISKNGIEEVVNSTFDTNGLKAFLSDMFYINSLCKARKGFSVIYSLYFYDSFTSEEAKKIRENGRAPRWLLYAMKGDENRKRQKSGLLGFFNR